MAAFNHLLCFSILFLLFVFGFLNINALELNLDSEQNSSKVKENSEQDCGYREHWDLCYAHCQHNCTNWGLPIPCPKDCVPGCVCDDGYVRRPDARCIIPNSCGSLSEFFDAEDTFETSETHKCPVKEHWDMCNAHCQKNCTNLDRAVPCTEVCVPGCVCNSGFVRGLDGKCTLPRLCPTLSEEQDLESEQDCGYREHWDLCYAHCQHNCTNWGLPIPCPKICVPGCVCDDGYVRGPDDRCIIPNACGILSEFFDAEDTFEIEDFCPPNEVFSSCLAHCQRNCSNWSDPSLPCQKVCSPGCICKNGMVRGPHGNCILPRRCPDRDSLGDGFEIECPVDEHFHGCNAHCQKNCFNWNKVVACPKLCISGCICDKGLIRGPSGRCILREKCPLRDEVSTIKNKNRIVCPEKEHPVPDLSGLQKYYRFFGNSFSFKTLIRGCVCNERLVRGPDDKCIERRLLPKTNTLDFMQENSDECEEDEWGYTQQATKKEDGYKSSTHDHFVTAHSKENNGYESGATFVPLVYKNTIDSRNASPKVSKETESKDIETSHLDDIPDLKEN